MQTLYTILLSLHRRLGERRHGMGLYSDNLYACFSNDEQYSKLCVCIQNRERTACLFISHLFLVSFVFVHPN